MRGTNLPTLRSQRFGKRRAKFQRLIDRDAERFQRALSDVALRVRVPPRAQLSPSARTILPASCGLAVRRFDACSTARVQNRMKALQRARGAPHRPSRRYPPERPLRDSRLRSARRANESQRASASLLASPRQHRARTVPEATPYPLPSSLSSSRLQPSRPHR